MFAPEPSARAKGDAFFPLHEEGHYYRQGRKPPGSDREAPQALQDIVSILTHANRAGRGNFVWLTWSAGRGSGDCHPQTRLQFGSTAIAVSKKGAAMLADAFASKAFPENSGHFDIDLKRWFIQEQERVGACYLVPPMGNHWEHLSGCDDQAGYVRPSSWGANWCCQGTRQSEDPKGREKWLCGWTAKAATTWLVAIPRVPTTDWLSYWAIAEEAQWLPRESHPPRDDPSWQQGQSASSHSRAHTTSDAAGSTEPVTRRRKRQAHALNTLCRLRFWASEIHKARAS